jgi:hypothetical protein
MILLIIMTDLITNLLSGHTPKKRARKLSYRKRHLALTSNDQVKIRRARLALIMILFRIKRSRTPEKKGFLMKLAKFMSFKLILLKYHPRELEKLPPLLRLQHRVEDFDEADCKHFFRFMKADILKLCRLLGFPAICELANRIILSGEEVMLRGLCELSTAANQHLLARRIFSGEASLQSRALKYFLNFIFDNFKHLVTDRLNWFHENGLLEESAVAIGNRMQAHGFRSFDGEFSNNVALFIDCNCLETSVCGGGPSEEGANSARWSDDIQRAFFNSWKSIHGLKHQTVDIAHGLTVDMIGPTSLRRNDMHLLGESRVNARLQHVQALDLYQLIIFGDSAYKRDTHIMSYMHEGDDGLIEDFARWNHAMKGVRISIEWNYGHTASLFPYVARRSKLKVLSSDEVSKVYTVCTILRNFHAILYGCQTSNYFNLNFGEDEWHFLECYINGNNL